MKVKSIIAKKLLTIDKDQTVATAVKKMEKNQISRLIVVDKNQLVGMVTLSDVADRLGSVKASTVPTSGLHVSGVMSSNPITIQHNMDVTEAAKIVVETGYSGFPVVNKEKNLVGILTKKDFFRRPKKFSKFKVKDFMTKNPDFVSTSTRLIEARDKLLKLNISVLPVYEGGKVVGIISKKLIAIALAEFRDEVPGKRISERIRSLQVGNHMLNNPPTITQNKTLQDAAKLLVKEYIHALPVVNRKGHLIAILTRGDLVKVLAK